MKTHTTRAAKDRRKAQVACMKVCSGEHAEGEYKMVCSL